MNIKSRAVAASFAASLMLVAAPANAAVATIIDVGQGTLLEKGNAADVPVTLVCDPGWASAQASVTLNQKVSQGRVTRAAGSAGFACTGQSQIVTVTSTVSAASNIPLKNGIAVADVTLVTCDASGSCDVVTIRREIFLKNN